MIKSRCEELAWWDTFEVGSGTHAGRGPRPLFPVSSDLLGLVSFRLRKE
jgi:hypothetical protein